MRDPRMLLDQIAETVGRTEDEEDEDHCWDHQTAGAVIDAVRRILEEAGIEIPMVG